MTDYHLDRHYSSHGMAYRGADPSMGEDTMDRSVTRGSHQSQTSGVSASTKSWVQSHRAQHPPPPPDESVSSAGVPISAPRRRPLPDKPPFRQSRVPVKYDAVPGTYTEEHEEFSHMGVDTRELPFGYREQEMGRGAADADMSHCPSSPTLQAPLAPPPSKSFVGGFFKGLKRPFKMFRGGEKGETRKLQRKGTFGTEITSTTATGIERGNTLPRYLSNPSIGPSNPQFAHRLSMAQAAGTLPATQMPAEFYHNDQPTYPTNNFMYSHNDPIPVQKFTAGPQRPIVTLTPPSDGIVEEEQADFYDGPTTEYPQHQLDDIMESEGSLRGRATVMMYSTNSQAPTATPSVKTPPPRRATPGPARVSYQQELPTRASVQAQTDSMAGPSAPRQSPLAPLHPVRSMQATTAQSTSPASLLSPPPTSASRYTMSTFASHYDPSFASHLSPVERFFKGLYNLPWVAERVTVDYRPADSSRAQRKVRGGKMKPMASWYRAVLARSRRMSRDFDALSAGTGTISGLALDQPPVRRRSAQSSTRRRQQQQQQMGHARRARRRVAPDAPQQQQQQQQQQQVDAHAASPVLPAPYPYAYPAVYNPYAYPYNYPGGYVPAPVPQTAPRGPRAHRRRKGTKHAHAHTHTGHQPHVQAAGYQPLAVPAPQQALPPVYFIAPSPPQSNNGGPGGAGGEGAGAQGGQQQMQMQQMQMQQYQAAGYQAAGYPTAGYQQISPVIMHYVPGAYGVDPAMISPPLTPQRQAKHAGS